MRFVVTLSVLWALAFPLFAADPPPIPDEAHRRLEHMLGRWRVETKMLAPDGSVRGKLEWENLAEWVIEDRVVLLTHQNPARGIHSRALVFFNRDTEKFTIVDVSTEGDLWILSGGLEGGFVLTSEPKRTASGEMRVRFSHEDVDENRTLVVMEYSTDDGKSWIRGQEQTLTRVE